MKWKMGSDSMELLRIGHFLLTRVNVLPLESMHWELKKKGDKTFLSTYKLCWGFPAKDICIYYSHSDKYADKFWIISAYPVSWDR